MAVPTVIAPVVGNIRAVACKVSLICTGASAGLTESISATVPLTSGLEKLVPSERSVLSVVVPVVYVLAAAAFIPLFVVVRIGYRHG